MSAKWGTPFTKNDFFKTRGGGEFQNQAAMWSNSVSGILVQRYSETLDRTAILYSHEKLADEMRSKVREIPKERANQL